MARGSASSSLTEKTFHISTFLPVFNFAWDSHCGYLPECCWSLNRSDWGVFSISPVQIINQIFGIILIFDNDTTMKCIIEIGNDQRTSLEIFLFRIWASERARPGIRALWTTGDTCGKQGRGIHRPGILGRFFIAGEFLPELAPDWGKVSTKGLLRRVPGAI